MATNDTPDQTTIYLAGPIAHTDDPRSWRTEVIERYPTVDFNNPLDKYDAPADELDIVSGDTSGEGEVTVSELVEGDKELLRDADAVLVGYEAVQSAGTPMEIHYAFRRGMPIAVWLRDGTLPDELSPWYRYHTDYRVWQAGHAVRYLQTEPSPHCRECGEELGAGYLCDECDTLEVENGRVRGQ